MEDQRPVNEAAVAAVRDFLGGPSSKGDDWTFDLGEHLSSNWGAVYGGHRGGRGGPGAAGGARSRAAQCPFADGPVLAVRDSRGDRTVRHGGRVVTTIEVELFDARQKLAAVGLITAVLPDALAQGYSNSDTPPFEVRDEELRAWDLTLGIRHAGTDRQCGEDESDEDRDHERPAQRHR